MATNTLTTTETRSLQFLLDELSSYVRRCAMMVRDEDIRNDGIRLAHRTEAEADAIFAIWIRMQAEDKIDKAWKDHITQGQSGIREL